MEKMEKTEKTEKVKRPKKEYNRKDLPLTNDAKTCFACNNVCDSRNQLNFHYGICEKFHQQYSNIKPEDRTWRMMIQFVREDMEKASRMCAGCGCVQNTRDSLIKHLKKCGKAIKAINVDQLDQLTLFGFISGTIYDDSAKYLINYKSRDNIPEFIHKIRDFAQRIRIDYDMKHENEYKHSPNPSPSPSPSPISSTSNQCNCSKCSYAYAEEPILKKEHVDAQSAGYYVIPMSIDGYYMEINGRRAYVPSQNIYVRIHDQGAITST